MMRAVCHSLESRVLLYGLDSTLVEISGTAGDDRIVVSVNPEWNFTPNRLLITVNGNRRTSNSGMLRINCDAGNDLVSIELEETDGGRVTIYGAAGNDLIVASDSTVFEVFAGDGNDTVSGSARATSILGDPLPANTIYGDAGDDRLISGAGYDQLDGGDGNDTLIGGEGDDTLAGGAGLDRLGGGAGADSLTGGASRDLLFGDEGADSLLGDGGQDALFGGDGDDSLRGGAGDDQLTGGVGEDGFGGGSGTNVFRDLDASDYLDETELTVPPPTPVPEVQEISGTPGDDVISVSFIRISGGAASYVLPAWTINGHEFNGFANSFRIDGGGGSDEIVCEDAMGRCTILGGAGDDFIVGSTNMDRIYAGDGNDVIVANTGADTIYGDGGDDSIRGGGGGDLLDGGAGDDTLRGDFGSDNISGGDGSDRLRGNNGNDSLHGGAGRDYLAGEYDSDMLWGDGGNDALDGGEAEDSLYGGAGADFLDGGAGGDFLDGGSGTDVVNAADDEDQFPIA